MANDKPQVIKIRILRTLFQMFSLMERKTLGIIITVLALVSVGQTAWYSWEQQKCNEAFAQNLAIQIQTQREDRETLNTLIRSVFTTNDERARMLAFREWNRQVAESDTKREKNPIQSPEEICD